MTILAYDRAGSVRSFDDNGRLRVEHTPISKANICTYQGREIPDYAALGLNPDQQYRLLRDPHELAKAAPTFNSLPVLEGHTPTSADAHPRELTVGATMDNAHFEAPYLSVGMVIFDGQMIARIQSGEQRELSCGYAYEADMTPGHYDGEAYDGRMTHIRGNHVALVSKGRAGPDVLVHDAAHEPSSPHSLSKENNRKNSAMAIATSLPHETNPAEEHNFKERLEKALTAMEDNMKQEGFTTEQAERCRALCAAHLEAHPLKDMPKTETDVKTTSGHTTHDTSLETENEDDTPSIAQREDTDIIEDTTTPTEADAPKEDLNAAIEKALAADRALRRATEEARRLVRPLVGDVHGMDSADDVYRYALSHSGMAADSLSEVNQAGLRALVHARLGTLNSTSQTLAQDALSPERQNYTYTTPRRY